MQVSATAAMLPQRPSQEAMYLQGQIHAAVGQVPLGLTVSTAHQPAVSISSPYLLGGGLPAPHISTQPPISQSVMSSTGVHENFPSAIPVVGGNRGKNLISVPIQDDDYGKKMIQPTQSMYTSHAGAALPNMTFPPPSFPQVGSLGPNIHQPPPSVPVMFSSHQTLPPSVPAPAFTSPPPQMNAPPRAPPRIGSGPLPRYFDGQGQRGPWSGPPRPQGPRAPPRADYNYY